MSKAERQVRAKMASFMRVFDGRRKYSKRHKGFSYLWVLLLIAFMGMGLMVAAEIDSTIAKRERERELIAIGRQFRVAIGRYYEHQQTAGRHEYPASLDDLLKDNRALGIRRHLRRIFVDPMTGKPEWGLVMVGGRIAGIHSLSAQLPIKQSGFEPEEMGLANKAVYSDWVFTYPADLVMQPASLADQDVHRNGAAVPIATTMDPFLQQGAKP